MFFHESEIKTCNNHKKYHDKRQNRIEIVRNCSQKQLKSRNPGIFRNIRIDGCRPAGNRRNDADRRSGRINDICQFCAGYFVAVSYRTHHRSDGQAIEIIIHKNQYSKSCGCQHCALLGLDLAAGPSSISS